MRVSLRIVVLLLVAALVVKTWLVLGLITPVVVVGGSMAPGLMGAHYQVECHDCGRSFACGAESLPEDRQVVCPSCGAFSEVPATDPQPGDRLFVDRTAFLRGTPQRWSVVVCPLPDDDTALCVKRVVGLPGERIAVSAGDVYTDGKILRKDWHTLAAMAIVVDSAAYRPSSDAAVSAWQPDQPDGHWSMTDDGFEFDGDVSPRVESADGVDWMTYHHQQILRQGGNVVRRTGPILDDLAYNQNESRELVATGDAILSCRLQSGGKGEVWLRAVDGRKEFVVRLDLARRHAEVREAGSVVAQFDLPTSMDLERPRKVSLALADCRLMLVGADTPVFEFPYDPADGSTSSPSADPFSIGAVGGPLSVTQWVVSRDIYYLPSRETTASGARELGPTEYWLLGDNSAVSEDSRTWPSKVRITRDALVGKILHWR